jgi:hypothetical protein
MQKGVNEMKNRIIYIVAMSISLLLSYGVYSFMSETNLAAAWAVLCFAVCEFFIQFAGFHFDFPFITKRLSKIMFDIVIFSRVFSFTPMINGLFLGNLELFLTYYLLAIIPLIIIFIAEKRSAGETAKQGFSSALIVSALFLMTSFMSIVVTFLFADRIYDSPTVLVAATLINIIINLIMTADYIKNKRNGGSPLLTAVSLFITTTPPVFSLTLFIAFVWFIGLIGRLFT